MPTLIKKKNRAPTSLLIEAFRALLEKLGPERTARVWHVLMPTGKNYSDVRKKLFAGKSGDLLNREIKKFNR